MKAIGWTLTCVLVAAAFSKNPVGIGAAGIFENDDDGGNAVNGSVAKFAGELSYTEKNDGDRGAAVQEGRTFGQKRLRFLLMPMIYKMGVMMTLLMTLTVISTKGLVVGVILLVLKLSSILAKFFSSPHHHGHPGPVWTPQPVHVHLHSTHPYGQAQAYNGWEPSSAPEEEQFYYKG